MWEKVIQIFKIRDLRNKIIFVLAMLAIFQLMAAIPIPGVDTARLKAFFEGNQIFGLLDIFSGGALSNLSVVMLGVAPYITGSIIMQLMTMIFPQLKELYQESGAQGRAKFNQYSRLLTVPLAIVQSVGLLTLLQNQQIIAKLGMFDFARDILIITAGTVFLMWLGELITEKGIGNGISLIIFAGIVAQLPATIQQVLFSYDPSQIPTYLVFLAIAVVVIAGVVFVSEAQRNIPVSYAKRIRGGRLYGGVSSYLPLRVNQAGVIPIIFAISILLFPGVIAQFAGALNVSWLSTVAGFVTKLFSNQFFYGSLYFILVVLFTYFYTAVTFEPHAIASNLQKQGGFVPGIRPGNSTAEFLYKVLNRITLFGALFLGGIAVLPIIVQGITKISALTLGGTALLIVVSVVLETMKQIQAQLVMRDYESF
ncbi:preprotein translocase subunit SecY [Candidatus Azambacteria bacterium RIFCSPHIGHO2_01_46_10]|uniref:Protein translocase subunit SecY n=2 Tax=Candidatus Azamiibacteriota TaxID=1752741 RepID=A0A1F5BXX3_9BACT|nr:MAG: preprotein translocase subunit SecY [Candidatus Azambacteria bacterium RIFCSPHIGHO2_02_46_12]OGD35443.1 MAG: preprotein translocase subunit SecY [Candidatus Azambacteria bacterium RIFCSPHIGHO2_01_46_10]